MRLLTLIITILALGVLVSAQTKFDSYGRLTTDDEAAHLDYFFNELKAHPEFLGYLVGYNQPSVNPGAFLRRLYGDHAYLTEIRGLEPGRVTVIEGGYRDKYTIELWLAPKDESAPTPTPNVTHRIDLNRRFMFDDVCLDCSPAVFLDLPGVGAGLRFYAAALKENPTMRALIITRPGPGSFRYTLSMARLAQRRLIRDHAIPSDRILIRAGKRRNDFMSTAELWLVPTKQ